MGLGDAASVAPAVLLAFAFGYAMTVAPVVRAGVPLWRSVRIALAADTVSIATMELVDNAFILAVPAAMSAQLLDPLFWWSLVAALVIAFVVTVPVNRWLIARGKGHAVVHSFHDAHPHG